MSKSPSLKNHLLTLEQKKVAMLQDLKDELKKYRTDPKMQWWVITLERKINEYH